MWEEDHTDNQDDRYDDRDTKDDIEQPLDKFPNMIQYSFHCVSHRRNAMTSVSFK